ncbi:MAG: MBL fold metallo-hydrolase [Bacteroidetes bacterium]|nr:MBL fold metallo-hydrolase [Bacteroidota bacterium]
MNIYSVNTGLFKLDGGAMFGVVPKSIWNKLNPADENNMCTWAMRCMLIQDHNRLILVDTGLGNKQSDKFFGYYYLHGDDTLEKSFHKLGFSLNDVTDVVLTHLHFDHCGGAIKWNTNKTHYEPVFRNATYWSTTEHWDWAVNPNAREKASFLKENILPIQESGQLKFIDKTKNNELGSSISMHFVNGHTESMMLPMIKYKNETIVFMADLMPSIGHIPVPYVMAYDTRPLVSLSEKQEFLQQAVKNNYTLFFEHDPIHECCKIETTERGFIATEAFMLNSL